MGADLSHPGVPRCASRRARRLCVLFATLTGAALASPSAAAPAFPGPESAFDEGAPEAGVPRVDGQLLIDAERPRRGETVTVGVLLRTAPEWHLYWRNPGGSGLPTRVAMRLDEVDVGPLQWPAPQTFQDGNERLTTYGYDGEVLLFADATLEGEGGGPVLLEATVDLLLCRRLCIPARLELERAVEVAPGAARNGRAPPGDPAVTARFARAAAAVPPPAEALGIEIEMVASQSAIRPGDHFELAIAPAPCDADPCALLDFSDPRRSVFVPETVPTIDLLVEGGRYHPEDLDRHVVGVFGTARTDDPAVDVQRLRGLLAVKQGDVSRYVEIDLPLPRAPAESEVTTHAAFPLVVANVGPVRALPGASGGVGLLQAIWLAFLGGLILNLMPCVLPVLAIKVFAIAELARSSRREIVAQGLAYTAGIVVSLLALATLVAAMRGAGRSVGWGFQFQEPIFVAAISAVLVLFAMNLFGAYEIGAPRIQLGIEVTGRRRGFFEGLLAVALATPCSAPFLATAVGFAFASDPGVIYAIFTSIGLGFAAPFFLVSLSPGLARLVPRSGGWMVHLRRALGFPLLATVLWLVWVAGQSLEFTAIVWLLGTLLVVAFGAWVYGALQEAGRTRWARSAGLAFAGVVALALVVLPTTPRSDGGTPREGALAWERFSPEAVDAALRSGRPVFVGFTADWCITCKANENLVLAREDVGEEFERLGVVAFLADWTRRDEAIRAELARFGKAGVPMYLVYGPGDPDYPVVLPEILTVDRVLSAVRDAAEGVSPRRTL